MVRAGSRRGMVVGTAGLVAAVAVSGLLSGCSSPAAQPSGSTAAVSAEVPAHVVQAAMRKAVDQRTVSVQVSVAGYPSPVATGVLSLGSPLQARLNVSATGLGGSTELLVHAGTVYVKVPAMATLAGGKPWLSASVDELRSIASSLPGATGQRLGVAGDLSKVSGADLLTTLASVPGAVRVGTGTTDGVATTHYRASESLAALAARAAAQGHRVPEALRSRLASGGTVTVDTWVDAAGLPRRITVSVTGAATTDARVPTSVDVRLSEFGTPVGPPPPVDQVGDLVAAMDRYAHLFGGITG